MRTFLTRGALAVLALGVAQVAVAQQPPPPAGVTRNYQDGSVYGPSASSGLPGGLPGYPLMPEGSLPRWSYYPYHYYPHSYWPQNTPQWPEAKGHPYVRPPAYMAYPAFKEPGWRYELWTPMKYYRGNHFWLDQF
ncbi:MAG: hypothetical protein ACKODX_05425 [Gemmata sp.]|jgi:hypothetical protein